MIQYWHMQLHPSDKDWGREKELLEQYSLIGFGEWKGGEKYIDQFKNTMNKGDVVAIKAGATLIALVEVIEKYEYLNEAQCGELDWFVHRRKVKVLAWAKKGQFLEQPRGTLSICDNLACSTSRTIIEWYQSIMRGNDMRDKIGMLKAFNQVIFYGPPGTGKTFLAKKIIQSMLKCDSEELKKLEFNSESAKLLGAWALVQFHPSYNYEDFVRGIQAGTDEHGVTYRVQNRIFASMCRAAKEAQEGLDESKWPPFILIVDEINRANVSSVLGELIYGLEYRGEAVSTPYALPGESANIIIPKNLYLIGTMNTADRSIGHIDYAVRRRFIFEQLLPDVKALEQFYVDKEELLKGKAIGKFKEVQELFSQVSPEYDKDDVAVGHSYFMASTEENLSMKIKYQIVPLLREYVKDGVLLQSASDSISKLINA